MSDSSDVEKTNYIKRFFIILFEKKFYWCKRALTFELIILGRGLWDATGFTKALNFF